MENKIICFVNVESDIEGLRKSFGDTYTQTPFCEKFLFNIDENGGYTAVIGDPEKTFLAISPKGVSFVHDLNNPPEWNLLLIHDSISVKNLSENYNILTGDTIVLYHLRASHKLDNIEKDVDGEELQKLKEKGQIKAYTRGMHEPVNIDRCYPLIYEIAKSWVLQEDGKYGFDVDKYQIALKKLEKSIFDEKSEITLRFLHDCLEKKPEDADYNKLKGVGIDISNLPKLEGNLYNEKYFTSLGKLRDELLKIVIED